MAKAAKIERTQKLFLKAMKEKFAEDLLREEGLG